MAKFWDEETGDTFSTDDILNGYKPKEKLPWTKTITGYKYNSDGSCNMGHVSDGYHTFDELYKHRTILFSTICRLVYTNRSTDSAFYSKHHSDGTMFPGMFIAGVKTDDGWVCYHIDNEFIDLFKGLSELDNAPEFDGATPEDGLNRLIKEFL